MSKFDISLETCPFCGGESIPIATSSCSGIIACIGDCGIQTEKFWDEPMTQNESERVKWYIVAARKWNRRK